MPRRADRPYFAQRCDHSNSSVNTFSYKYRLYSIIKKQKKQFVWKELSGIFAVQIIIWAIAIYNIALLDRNYNTDMSDLIDLRKGVYYFALRNARMFSSTIAGLDVMFEKAGMLDKNRYRRFIAGFNRNASRETVTDYQLSINYTSALMSHIYSFEWKYAERYLRFTSNYDLNLSSNQKANLSLHFDVNSIYYIVFAAYNRWNPTVNTDDFDNEALLDQVQKNRCPND